MPGSLRIKVFLTRGARADMHELNRLAHLDPHGRDADLLEASLVMLSRLNGRRHPTKPLDYDSRFADLSDCDTTYVGADPYEKPPLRIVSRDIRPDTPGGITRREIIAIGAREQSKVYRTTGQRLGRPIGVTLDELTRSAQSAQPAVEQQRPGHHVPTPQRSTQVKRPLPTQRSVSYTPSVEINYGSASHGPEFGG